MNPKVRHGGSLEIGDQCVSTAIPISMTTATTQKD